MKSRYAFIIVLLISFLPACTEDWLDQDPGQMNTIEKVFETRSEALRWHARLFSQDYFRNRLRDASWFSPFFNATDDAANMMDWHIQQLLLGQINPAQPTTGEYFFRLYYQAIRHANIFLENIHKTEEMGESERNRVYAEAKFMRAYYHFMLLRAYGPVPIVESSETDALPGRNTLEENVDWLINELNGAINAGLNQEQIGPNLGFPTVGAAMAMKSRILLLAASPIYNGNQVYAGWRNPDGTQLVPQDYDNEKWKRAADAALELINLNRYSLFREVTGDPEELFDEYVENYRLVTTTWNDEIIWARPSWTNWWVSGCLPAVFSGWNGRNSVTLELVNAYFMADGSVAKPMDEWFVDKQFSDEPGNGTVENTFWMFTDREPRFYAGLHFPNMKVSYAPASHPDAEYILEFFRTGNSGLNVSAGDRNFTAFTPRKHVPLESTSYQGTDGTVPVTSPDVPYPIFRLAEIYLNYCEAMNEYSGAASHPDILPYLNAIRTRAGLPEYHGSFSKEEMREMIRNERRIELAWEEHRYFDVRRWFIAHGPNGVFNRPVHGLDLSVGTHSTDKEHFTKTQIMNRVFRLEHYFLPIRASEIAYNTNLVQAPFY